MTSLNQTMDSLLRRALAKPEPLSLRELEGILRLMGKWRHQMISNSIIARDGPVVQSGPFAGMRLGQHSAEGCHAPKLLGCYEQALHPHFERFIARGFDAVLNIGSAEGYYAIGLARRMPGTEIFAHDLNEGAQLACRALAEANDVSDRITIGGLVLGEERFEPTQLLCRPLGIRQRHVVIMVGARCDVDVDTDVRLHTEVVLVTLLGLVASLGRAYLLCSWSNLGR
jgi:hypothetical protein